MLMSQKQQYHAMHPLELDSEGWNYSTILNTGMISLPTNLSHNAPSFIVCCSKTFEYFTVNNNKTTVSGLERLLNDLNVNVIIYSFLLQCGNRVPFGT
jgi:hypothetical protein